MKKILVLGICGAGKSSLSKKLSDALDLPLYHLDSVYWQANWKIPKEDEWHTKLNNILSKPEWIMDGNYCKTLEMRIKSADTVIFLNIPKHIAIYRVLKRSFTNFNMTRPDMGKDCKEKFDFSFLKYVWNFNSIQKNKILNILNENKRTKSIIYLKGLSEIKKFSKNITKNMLNNLLKSNN